MIVADLQALQSASFGRRGIGRYVADLARALATRHPGAVDVFAWNDALPYDARFDDLDLGERLRPFSELRGLEVDVLHVHAPFDMVDWADLVVPVRARRLVVTCFDLIPYRFPEVYLADPTTRARYLSRLAILNSADAVVADSRSAADDVVELAGVHPDRVTVIGGGVGPQFVPPSDSLADRLARLRQHLPALGPRFVLVPTGMDWRKNIEGAIRAFGRLDVDVRERHQLVLTCSLNDDQRGWMHDVAADAGIPDRIVIAGHVDDDVLVALYQTAELVFFPSFYEGFGLPVLEARRCGARVICSNTSSLPEVLLEPRAWFDPWDAAAVTASLGAALADPAVGAMLERVPDAGLTWERAADRLVGVYEALRPASPSRTVTIRPRLGVVTVLPPAPSGVADHSERLLAALHHELADVDVTAFVEGAPESECGFPVEPLAALPTRWASGDLDAVLYCVGNNRLHRNALTLIPIVPGHVLLHDVYLGAAIEPPRLDVIAARCYADRTVGDEPEWSAGVARAAISLFVQSAHAAELVRSDSGVDAIDVGPHPCEVVAEASPIDDGGLPWVVTAGIAHEVKYSDVIAEAMRQLVREGVARAAIVGARGELYAGDDDGIVVTGHVDDDEFDGWLRRAGLLVQLRRSSQGESSGVVAHAMARGVPLLVSDLGAMAELPEAAAARVAGEVTAGSLAGTIRELLADPDRLASMRVAGAAFAARETPAAQARRIVDKIFS